MSSVEDNKMSKVFDPSIEVLAISERKELKEAAIIAFHRLQKESKVHHFKDEDAKEHLAAWKLVKFAEEKVAYGVNYFFKVCIDARTGHCIHLRAHRQQHHAIYDFYSLHRCIHHNDVTYVWDLNHTLEYFNI